MITAEWSIVILFILLLLLSFYYYSKVIRRLDNTEEKNTILSQSYKYSYFTIVFSLLFIIVYQLTFYNYKISYVFILTVTAFVVLLVKQWTVIIMGNKVKAKCEQQSA
ncbi:hypothetical protein AJ85_11870 [Alkalihalobacillus alcalophilus ATCC 27647 = CGMCC 1.3604]|uniref:Uncharacterized protein n=1 Tax=Alkalihalobacillus alcalophilus ATCC 27647 = CGMCC 1.3604 TaxID=1218173 RepID=A0A094YWD0_ALKAL|nr:hypothetical protein [Alkalihalobacillus alcalophilus]KGA97817.1 hypothetical protein BALCAV_0207810 [Alkalihalobacillus alcalophilus ATCC 27647 = CGMCC 1.3604]MED1563907.1 hypothetical protein [Alkalihalobacillus alcalophilus]THG90249.1 hypothetical protein AJ85_11870 [Alkalihalobacillus alcalophilus ATCC 27647 = CGMCC 1.3604]